MVMFQNEYYEVRVSDSGESYDVVNTKSGVVELGACASLPRCIILAKESSDYLDRLKAPTPVAQIFSIPQRSDS